VAELSETMAAMTERMEACGRMSVRLAVAVPALVVGVAVAG
jgi:hypothetical protein